MKCTDRYKLSKSQEDQSRQTVCQKRKRIWSPNISRRIYSQDIGMQSGIAKCSLLIMTNRKRHRMEGIELPNQEKNRRLGENETYKYLEIFEADTIK